MPDIRELSQVLAMLQTLQSELKEVTVAAADLGYRWLADELRESDNTIASITKTIEQIVGVPEGGEEA